MSRAYKEFGDLLSAYNEADEKWMPIQKAHELLGSANEDEIWEQRNAAANALFKYIAELTTRITELEAKKDILENQMREAKNILIDKRLHIDSLYEDGYKLQKRIAELEAVIDQLIEAGEKMFTAVIAAADSYDEGMRVWNKIVNDWKER